MNIKHVQTSQQEFILNIHQFLVWPTLYRDTRDIFKGEELLTYTAAGHQAALEML